jgi:hypothetical protein
MGIASSQPDHATAMHRRARTWLERELEQRCFAVRVELPEHGSTSTMEPVVERDASELGAELERAVGLLIQRVSLTGADVAPRAWIEAAGFVAIGSVDDLGKRDHEPSVAQQRHAAAARVGPEQLTVHIRP